MMLLDQTANEQIALVDVNKTRFSLQYKSTSLNNTDMSTSAESSNRGNNPEQNPRLQAFFEDLQSADTGITLLKQTLIGFGLGHFFETSKDALTTTPYSEHHQYTSFYNHDLYQKILPICQLAYLVEHNGIAEEHAFKLSTIFNNEQQTSRAKFGSHQAP